MAKDCISKRIPNTKSESSILKATFSFFRIQNQLSSFKYSAVKILPKLGFRRGSLIISQNPYYEKVPFFSPTKKSSKFLYLAQLKYCQKLDFEGEPNNKHLGVN